MVRGIAFAALLSAASAAAQPPQAGANFLKDAFAREPHGEHALLAAGFPNVSLLFANRAATAERSAGGEAMLRAPGSEAVLVARLEHSGVFDFCRIRHKPGSPIPLDELKLVWSFPMEFNESMTLDAGALEGHPLYLPDGTVPPAHFLNWGTLFYSRSSNLALGTTLEGAEPAAARWGRRTGPTGPTQLHFWTSMGRPDLQLTIFAYHPQDTRLWWAEWYQEQERRLPGSHPGLFPILSPQDTGWAPGERQEIDIVPGPADAGKTAEFVLIDDVSSRIVGRKRFEYQLPVTQLMFEAGDWPSALYRAIVLPAGETFDPAVRRFDRKMFPVILRPRHVSGSVLFVAPTDMWRAYASNGGHAMTSWRDDYHYTSVGYSPTVLNTRFRRTNHYYYGLYERHSDIQHYEFLRELSRKDGFQIDYATQDDVALDRVRLSDYRLVLIGSHAEFTTAECYFRFRDYLARGGAVMIHGGDSFAVMVDYLPSLRDRRYIWQRDHIWCHLTDQPDTFMPPRLLPADASAEAPITSSDAGDAIDYLNLFHVSVGYWPEGSQAVVSNVDHPVMRGLGLKLGDPMPIPWAGETDMTYEPRAWDILLRSDRAVTEDEESGLARVTQPAFHHTALMIHKNLRLAAVSGEGFTTVLADPRGRLFQTIYARTLHYLLDSALDLHDPEKPQPAADGLEFRMDAPIKLSAIRYSLPAFIDYQNAPWFRKPAPYAHYLIEGSNDATSWTVLADRTHGPWRGVQTDFLPATLLRRIRFRGTFSNQQPFQVTGVEIFRTAASRE